MRHILFACEPVRKTSLLKLSGLFLSEITQRFQAIIQTGLSVRMNVSVSFYVNFLYKPLESVAVLWSVKQAREVGCENKEACTATVNEVASG